MTGYTWNSSDVPSARSCGVSGDMIGYWKFFPAEGEWGIIPVWGFGTVVESRCPEVPVGDRVWGFLPMASHVVMKPGSVRATAYVDAAEHRKLLPELYNRYQRTHGDPPALKAMDVERCALFPLFNAICRGQTWVEFAGDPLPYDCQHRHAVLSA